MAQPDPFQEYLRVQRRFDAQLLDVLESTAKSIHRELNRLDKLDGIGARVRSAQYRAVLGEIHAEIASLWGNDVSSMLIRGRKAAAEAAQKGIEAISRVAYASMSSDAAEELTRSLKRTARAGIETNYARIPRELAERVYRNGVVANGTIDKLSRPGLISGKSARELAATVYQYVSPSTPGGVAYAAKRLARTEINNAFHEQQIRGADEPGVTAVRWNLSGSHPRPDECNQFAEKDSYDLGPGRFPKNSVPKKPHPHCFCYLTYVSLDPAEFLAKLKAGDFDAELRRRTQLNLDRLKQDATPVAQAQRAADRRTGQARSRGTQRENQTKPPVVEIEPQ